MAGTTDIDYAQGWLPAWHSSDSTTTHVHLTTASNSPYPNPVPVYLPETASPVVRENWLVENAELVKTGVEMVKEGKTSREMEKDGWRPMPAHDAYYKPSEIALLRERVEEVCAYAYA